MTLRLRWISDRHARTLRRSLLILLLALLLPQLAAADGVFTQRARYDGTYGMITGGVGLSIVMPGDIVLNVPGPVVQAYLYWAGQDLDPGGDSSVGLSVNSGPVNTINADRSYGPDYWNGSVSSPPIRYNYVWVADVTSLILAGSNTYTISGFGPMYLEYGAGLVVVYQDGALPYGFVEVVEGLDGAYFNYTSPRGPNTEVSCVQFAAEASPRTMDISFFVGGVDVSGGPASRPNAIWHQTGTGALPTDLVNQPGATEIGGQPLDSKNGEEWDTYTDSITVPAGDTYACFQIESVADMPPQGGASLMWLNLTVNMQQQALTATPTTTGSPTATATNTQTATFTPTSTSTPTPTNTATPGPSPTPSNTSPATNTPVPSNTPSASNTPVPTSTSGPTPVSSPSSTQNSALPQTGFGDEFSLSTWLVLALALASLALLAHAMRWWIRNRHSG